MNNDIENLHLQIKKARAYAKQILECRARVAGVLSGGMSTSVELEFPEPDIMHTYSCMFGYRVGDPTVYRLSFGSPLKWIGLSHPWGLKPSDIVVSEKDIS